MESRAALFDACGAKKLVSAFARFYAVLVGLTSPGSCSLLLDIGIG